jgi:hypothetical protein
VEKKLRCKCKKKSSTTLCSQDSYISKDNCLQLPGNCQLCCSFSKLFTTDWNANHAAFPLPQNKQNKLVIVKKLSNLRTKKFSLLIFSLTQSWKFYEEVFEMPHGFFHCFYKVFHLSQFRAVKNRVGHHKGWGC